MSGRRHWSEGTPFENVKVGAPVAGMPWTLSPANPVPPGFVVDKNGRLATLSGGFVTSVEPPASAAVKSTDVLLAEARAMVGSAQPRPQAGAWCGRCGPCRNGSRSQCLHLGTAHAVACRKADEAQGLRQLHESTAYGMLEAAEYKMLHANDRHYRDLDSNRVWAG